MSHAQSNAESIGTRIELDVMYLLAKQPMSPKELTLVLPYSYFQIKYTIQNLRESDCIHRLPGSHKMALTDL